MTNLQMIEALCNLIEDQASLIKYLSIQLEEARELTEAEQSMIASTRDGYTAILGADEVPDFLA